jgi:hypothetical protein
MFLDRSGGFDWDRLNEAGIDDLAAHLAETGGDFDLEGELERLMEDNLDDALVTAEELKRIAAGTKQRLIAQ